MRTRVCNDLLFRQFGLTPAQYNILRILRGEGKPLPCLEIADRLVQVVPAITGLIDRLELAEMVSRKRCETDRRVVYVEITDRARTTLAQMDEPVIQLHKSLLGHLTRTELKELNRLLEKARESQALWSTRTAWETARNCAPVNSSGFQRVQASAMKPSCRSNLPHRRKSCCLTWSEFGLLECPGFQRFTWRTKMILT